MSPIFHKDVGIPDEVIIPDGRIYLEPSNHAEKEAKNDKYLKDEEDKLKMPDSVKISEEDVFEVKIDENKIIKKIGFRTSYDSDRDLVIVATPTSTDMFNPRKPWTVKTVWVNMKDDKHSTLNESEYDSPDYF